MSERGRTQEEILRDLERLRKECPPELYAKASARLLHELKRAKQRRPRYAIT